MDKNRGGLENRRGGYLTANVFTGERIEILDGDPYEPALWVCRSMQGAYGPFREAKDYGREAPGRRYVFDRAAPADDNPPGGSARSSTRSGAGTVWKCQSCGMCTPAGAATTTMV